MNRQTSASAPFTQRIAARTVDGIEFDPTAFKWRIPTASGNVCLNINNLPGIAELFRHQVRDVFAALLLANAPERLRDGLTRLRGLLRYLVDADQARVISELTAADIENYGAALPKHQGYFLRVVRSILVEWARTGIGGLSHDLVLLLPALETERHIIGAAVSTMDPTSGPLTDIEYEAVISEIRSAYACGTLSVSDYSLLILAISLGCRTLQLAMMKVKDLTITPRSDGSKIYVLQVTRLKQGKNIRPRSLFKPRELSGSVGLLLEEQIEVVREWAKRNLIELPEAPLFPSTKLGASSLGQIGLTGHSDAGGMSSKIARLLNRLGTVSERTGEAMKLFQTRMRRTLGSRAAAEGLSLSVIADLMDHSWADSSLVYIETRPEIIERIDKALALKVAPLAQAFIGVLESKPIETSGMKERIIHVNTLERIESIGACGKYDFCGLAAPLACYTCTYFHPWLDNTHEFLLERLLVERDEIVELCDPRIASVNDRTIYAVADVVNRCRAASGKTER